MSSFTSPTRTIRRKPPPRFDSLPSIRDHGNTPITVTSTLPKTMITLSTRPTHKVNISLASSIASTSSSSADSYISGVSSSRTDSTGYSSILDFENCDYTRYQDCEDDEDEEDLDELYTSYELHNSGLAQSSMILRDAPADSDSNGRRVDVDQTLRNLRDPRAEECRSSVGSKSSDHHQQQQRTVNNHEINSPDDLLQQLALLRSGIETCFCGQPADSDSIYCSRECSRADAMRALCGGQDDDASVTSDILSSTMTPVAPSPSLSCSSLSRLGSGEGVSHYRRRVERKRAEERASQEQVASSKWQSQLGNKSNGSSSSRRPSVSSLASTASSSTSASVSTSATSLRSEKRKLPSQRRTSNSSLHSNAPSLSSIKSSSSVHQPRVSSMTALHDESSAPFDPTSPNRSLRTHGLSAGRELSPSGTNVDDDLFSAYLDATPTLANVHAARRRISDEEYGVAPREQQASPRQPGNGLGSLGLMMLQRDDDEEDEDGVAGLGQGKQLQERVRKQMTPRPGHTRGKLSFDDVLSLLGS